MSRSFKTPVATIVFFLLVSANVVFSQSISRSVISSGGNYSSTASGRLYSNLGELSVATLSPGNIITQGFVQPVNPIVTALDPEGSYSSYSLYPNPASSSVNIQLCSTCELIKLDLFDHLGKKVLEGPVMKGQKSEKYVLDISGLAPGIYIVNITDSGDPNSFTSIKFVKLAE